MLDESRIAGEYLVLSPNRSISPNLYPPPFILFPLRIDANQHVISSFTSFWESPELHIIIPEEFESQLQLTYTIPDTIGQWESSGRQEIQIGYEIHGREGIFEGYAIPGYAFVLVNKETKDTYIGIKYSQIKEFVRNADALEEGREYLGLAIYDQDIAILSMYMDHGERVLLLSQQPSGQTNDYGGVFKREVGAFYSNSLHAIFLSPLVHDDILFIAGYDIEGKRWFGICTQEQFTSNVPKF